MVWLFILIVLVSGFAAGAIFGAPYLPVLRRDSEALLDLAGVKEGQILVDLGSGDGRLLLAAAQRGCRGVGYEINPLLWLVSLVVCWPERDKVQIFCRNFWNQTLPQADVIYVFLIDRYMHKLDQKLKAEITKPTKLVSFTFQIPGKKPVDSNKNTYVYRYPNSAQ